MSSVSEDVGTGQHVDLAVLGHELRNPIAGVLANAELLAMDELGPGQAEAVGQILDAANHLHRLVERHLTPTAPAGLVPVRVRDVAAKVLDLSRPLATPRSITLEVTGDGALEADVDSLQLTQVLLNLVSNAVKYGNDGGLVRIHVEAAGQRLIVSVIDNGPGIPEAKLERLFTAFDRLGASSGGEPGSGLGLAICRQLVASMGGAIRVVSQPGLGTRFTVELPAARDGERAAPGQVAGADHR